MVKSRFILFHIIFYCIPLCSIAKEYYCPETPITIRAGEILEADWYIWPLGEAWSESKKDLYYKKKSLKLVQKWNTFPHGWLKGAKKNKFFIACCRMSFETKETICAYKEIPEKYCIEKVIGEPHKKFICSEQPIDKSLGDSPFHGK